MRLPLRGYWKLSPVNNKPEGPNFRDLYDLQAKIQERLEKQGDQITRLRNGLVVLAAVVASPKIGGPDAAKLVAEVLGVNST